MIHLVIGILVIALVWVLTYVLGPGLGVFGGGRGHA
jgi:hypothetical protein